MAAILSCLSGVRELALLLALLWSINCEVRGCQCGTLMYTDTNGRVTSPNYPRNYPNNCRCRYRISVDSKFRIRLQLSSYRFAGRCDQDYALVYDGSPTRDNLLRRICQINSRTTTLTSQGSLLTINFISNRNSRSSGFSATYSIIAPTTPKMTSTPAMTQMTSSTTLSTTSKNPTILLPTTTITSTSYHTTPVKSNSDRYVTSSVPSISKGPEAKFSTNASSTAVQPTGVQDMRTDNVISTVDTNTITDEFIANPHSAVEDYIWMSFAGLGVLLLFLNGIVILTCCIKRRQKRKRMNPVNGNTTTNALDDDDPTIIVNQTYQASDDFIASNVHGSPKQPASDNSTVSKVHQNTAVYSFPDAPSKINSHVYQSTNEYSPIEKNQKYAKVSAGSNGEHFYQTAEISTSPYAGITSPVSASYQSPDMIGQYEYPSVIGRREGLSSVPNSPISGDQGKIYNSLTSYQDLQPLELKDPPGRFSEPVDTSNRNNGKSDTNQYQPLTIETPLDGDDDYSLAVAPGNKMDSTYLQPDVFPDVRKVSDNHEYDLVHTDDYQKITEKDAFKNDILTQSEQSSDPYDVVNLNLSDQGKSSTEELERNSAVYESFGVLKSQEVTPAIGESGYTEYNAEGVHGAYQDLKPEESPLFGRR